MNTTERIWIEQRQLRKEWFADPYEMLTWEEFHVLVEAVCAQYETLHDTKLVVRLLPDGCNLSCWPNHYDYDRFRIAIATAMEQGFDDTNYLPSQRDIAERLWGLDGYFAAVL